MLLAYLGGEQILHVLPGARDCDAVRGEHQARTGQAFPHRFPWPGRFTFRIRALGLVRAQHRGGQWRLGYHMNSIHKPVAAGGRGGLCQFRSRRGDLVSLVRCADVSVSLVELSQVGVQRVRGRLVAGLAHGDLRLAAPDATPRQAGAVRATGAHRAARGERIADWRHAASGSFSRCAPSGSAPTYTMRAAPHPKALPRLSHFTQPAEQGFLRNESSWGYKWMQISAENLC